MNSNSGQALVKSVDTFLLKQAVNLTKRVLTCERESLSLETGSPDWGFGFHINTCDCLKSIKGFDNMSQDHFYDMR